MEWIKCGISVRLIVSKMLNLLVFRKVIKMIVNSSEGIDIIVLRIWFKVLESSFLVMLVSVLMVLLIRVVISVIRMVVFMLNSELLIRWDKIFCFRLLVLRK